MKYLCLIYVDETKLQEAPPAHVNAVAQQCLDQTRKLEGAGRLLAAERLESVLSATTVRHEGGKITVTDGPFAETKEQLAGFYLIDAHDLDEAIRIAGEIPPGHFGCIEVRPIMQELHPAEAAPAARRG